MVNLSTVYAISIILASMAGMGSAFVGHKFYPIKGGAAIPPPSPAEVYAEAQKTAELAKKLASAQIPPKPEETAEPVYTSSPEPEPAPSSSPEPSAPAGPEEIPAKAPTDTNNEPSQIPTYLPTPEEENPTGGALGLQERIEQEFGMNEEFATNVMLFITTPVEDWAQIASTQDELFQKFKDTLTDPQLGTCPATLKDICKIVVVKYTNMEKLINGKEYVPYGDQTEEASRLLSSIA